MVALVAEGRTRCTAAALVFAALADGDRNGDAGAGMVSLVYLLLHKAEERSPAMGKFGAGCAGRKKEVIKCSI